MAKLCGFNFCRSSVPTKIFGDENLCEYGTCMLDMNESVVVTNMSLTISKLFVEPDTLIFISRKLVEGKYMATVISVTFALLDELRFDLIQKPKKRYNGAESTRSHLTKNLKLILIILDKCKWILWICIYNTITLHYFPLKSILASHTVSVE